MMADGRRGVIVPEGRATVGTSVPAAAPGAGTGALPPSIWVVAVLVAFFTLRAAAWLHFDPVTFDSAVYFEIAELIRKGRWWEALTYDYPPLYPLLIACVGSVVGAADTAGVLIAFASDLLIMGPIVAVTRRAVGEEAAWAAAFLWAVHLSAVRLGVQALTDAPAALCVATALYAGLRAIERCRLTWAVGAGMVSGLAFLFRPEGLEPALALAAFYAFQCRQPVLGPVEPGGTRVGTRHSALGTPVPSLEPVRSSFALWVARRASWILAPLVGWAFVAGPYVAAISVEAGTLTLSKKKSSVNFVRSAIPLATPESPDPGAMSRGREQPPPTLGMDTMRRWAERLYLFQKPLVNGLTVMVIVPACIGSIGILTRKKGRWNPALGLLAGLFVLHVGILTGLAADKGVTYLGRHHFLLTAVYALPVAGAGLVWALGWMSGRPRGRLWAPATLLCGVVFATGFSVVTRGPDYGRSLRSAAAWIRSQVVGTPIIVTRLAKLTYHANAERVDIAGSYEEILRRARDRSAHFVALYPDMISQTSPDFLTHVKMGDLELVKVFPEPSATAPDQRLELYRLRPKDRPAGS